MRVTDRGLDGAGVASSEQHDRTPSDTAPGHGDGRVVVYTTTGGRAPDDASWFAIDRLARVAQLVVVVGGNADGTSLGGEPPHERILRLPSAENVAAAYRAGVKAARSRVPGVREVVLTGDSWFGPLDELVPLLERMRDVDADFWHMVAPAPHREGFPGEGFPVVDERAWMWLAVGPRILDSDHWDRWWAGGDGASGRERDFAGYFERRGMRGAVAVVPVDATEHDPLLFSPEALVESGLPFVDRAVFSSFPPLLERKAVIGREVAATLADRGYPSDVLWSSLARTVAPKALNTNGGMLEVLSGSPYRGTVAPARVVVVVHVSDMDAVPDLLGRIDRLPVAAHVVATVTEGISATRLQRVLEAWTTRNPHEFEIRVTPASDGRDMADFFAGCRDLLAPGRFDLVVKLHARRAGHRSMNQQRYFRRYQLDNLLESEGYVSRVLELFATQPRLGVVFPPMIHVGYRTMGRGWAGLRPHAEQLSRDLGISVPLDVVSPLAPYGGMFIARPEALVALTSRRWTFSDYGRRRQRRFGHLAHLQERMIPLAAGESGFFCRTVMTFEHAEIAHTALDFKADQISATTRGWPVEKIRFLHRAGYTGYGGTVALVRMYVRVNHPRLAAAARPGYRLALAAYRLVSPARETVRRALAERAARDDGSTG